MKKKGIFFTLIAVILISILIMVFTPASNIALKKEAMGETERIRTVDSFIDDLQNNYFVVVLNTATYKSLLSLAYYVGEQGYITDLNLAFSEVILNGTINDVPIDTITGMDIMQGNTLKDWSSLITQAAKDTYNINVTISISNISLSQSKPWTANTRMILNMNVKSEVSEWETSQAIKATVSIEGLKDPYYLANSNGNYLHTVKRANVDSNKWNSSALRDHIKNGTYIHWTSSAAPSFLGRYTHNMSASSCCGIESTIDPDEVNPPNQEESYVDYLFWENAYDCDQLYDVTVLWSGNPSFRFFKLDSLNKARFKLADAEAQPTAPCN